MLRAHDAVASDSSELACHPNDEPSLSYSRHYIGSCINMASFWRRFTPQTLSHHSSAASVLNEEDGTAALAQLGFFDALKTLGDTLKLGISWRQSPPLLKTSSECTEAGMTCADVIEEVRVNEQGEVSATVTVHCQAVPTPQGVSEHNLAAALNNPSCLVCTVSCLSRANST